ncbi:MAG: glycosyl hydrolase family 28-related protein [Planctomycetota bacterium]|nr:glycosyl hydrolase family 28-related protein [Planctomycetota bacterium]
MRIALSFALFLLAATASAQPTTAPTQFDVTQYGAKGDAQSDATPAFQQALDAAAKAGGGTVYAPKGNYLFKSHLNVPNNVTLKGIWESVPAHNGIRDRGMPKPTDDGTTFLVTEGAGKEDAPPFITLNTNSTLKGVCIYYPDQDPKETPKPYPYAIAMRGKNPAVLDVELLNPFNGIDASQNERHLIRNISGQPLRRGVFVDSIYDIGRIENVHFNPWWSNSPKVREFQFNNGEAFIFARTDWQYVLNTFCFGYKVGYKFAQTRAGVCNGNFLGIGADDCQRAVLVEQSAPMALLITNGEFVAFNGPDPVMVEVTKTHSGAVRFVNCAFWGPCQQIARIAGPGTVGFSDCTFVQWDKQRKGLPALQIDSGSVIVRGCEFRENKPQITLAEPVRRAIITGNLLTGPARITNNSKGSVVISDNAPTP